MLKFVVFCHKEPLMNTKFRTEKAIRKKEKTSCVSLGGEGGDLQPQPYSSLKSNILTKNGFQRTTIPV